MFARRGEVFEAQISRRAGLPALADERLICPCYSPHWVTPYSENTL